MKVGYDIAPLVIDNAGTARYVRGVLEELRHRDELEVHELSWGGPGRATAALRDVAWYPALLPLHSRSFDVLHCTTYRAPLAAPAPVVVTVHDLAAIRFPEHFTPWTRTLCTDAAEARRCARRLACSRSQSSPNGMSWSLPACLPSASDVAYKRGGHHGVRAGRSRGRGRVPAGGGHARAAEEPAAADRGDRGRSGSSSGSPVRRAGAASGRRVRTSPGSAGRRTRSSRRCCAAHSVSSYPSLWEGFGIPVARGDALRLSGRDEPGGAMEEVSAGPRSYVDPNDVDSIPAGIERALARRDELRAAGFLRAKAFGWGSTADAVIGCYRQAVA